MRAVLVEFSPVFRYELDEDDDLSDTFDNIKCDIQNIGENRVHYHDAVSDRYSCCLQDH